MLVDLGDVLLNGFERAPGFANERNAALDFRFGGADEILDFAGGGCGALGKFSDLLGNNGESFAGSPARAASTPAFSARRLVWNAMSSITPMMLDIWRDDPSIFSIASTALATT